MIIKKLTSYKKHWAPFRCPMFFNEALIIFDKMNSAVPKKSIISVTLHLTDVASKADDLVAVAELVIVP